MYINIIEIFMIVAVIELFLFTNNRVLKFLNKHPLLIWPFEKLKETHLSKIRVCIIFSLVGLLWFDIFIRIMSQYSYSLYKSVTFLVSKFHNPSFLNLSQNYFLLGFGIILTILGLGFFLFPMVIFIKIIKEELRRPRVKV